MMDFCENPARKTWWAKRLCSKNYYTAGRLTERQIKYAAEDGFKSVVALFTYAVDDTKLPSTRNAKRTAEELSEIQFVTVLNEGNRDWKNADTVMKVSAALENLPRPILFCSDYAYSATFLLLAHFAKQSSIGIHFDDPYISAKDVFQIGTHMGFNFGEDPKLVSTIASITGEHIQDPPKYTGTIPEWYKKFWMLKPVDGNLYVSGQIQTDHLADLNALDLVSWINSRKGTHKPPNDPSQEEVTLLNIDSEVDTYTKSGRQSDSVLQESILDPSKPLNYVGNRDQINYEKENRLEFGDHIGYNEKIQRSFMEQHFQNVDYFHLPIGGQYDYDKEMWEAFRNTLADVGSRGPVLMQCRTGYRASVLSIMAIAEANGYNSTWANAKAMQMGYVYEEKIRDLLEEVLDRDTNCTVFNSRNVAIALISIAVVWGLMKVRRLTTH